MLPMIDNRGVPSHVFLNIVLTAGVLSGASIHTDFEAGCLGPIKQVSDTRQHRMDIDG